MKILLLCFSKTPGVPIARRGFCCGKKRLLRPLKGKLKLRALQASP